MVSRRLRAPGSSTIAIQEISESIGKSIRMQLAEEEEVKTEEDKVLPLAIAVARMVSNAPIYLRYSRNSALKPKEPKRYTSE